MLMTRRRPETTRSAVVCLEHLFGETAGNLQRLALPCPGSGKPLGVLLHPQWRIARHRVLPRSEPQEHDFQLLPPCLLISATHVAAELLSSPPKMGCVCATPVSVSIEMAMIKNSFLSSFCVTFLQILLVILINVPPLRTSCDRLPPSFQTILFLLLDKSTKSLGKMTQFGELFSNYAYKNREPTHSSQSFVVAKKFIVCQESRSRPSAPADSSPSASSSTRHRRP